jgi:hypothetical protein
MLGSNTSQNTERARQKSEEISKYLAKQLKDPKIANNPYAVEQLSKLQEAYGIAGTAPKITRAGRSSFAEPRSVDPRLAQIGTAIKSGGIGGLRTTGYETGPANLKKLLGYDVAGKDLSAANKKIDEAKKKSTAGGSILDLMSPEEKKAFQAENPTALEQLRKSGGAALASSNKKSKDTGKNKK